MSSIPTTIYVVFLVLRGNASHLTRDRNHYQASKHLDVRTGRQQIGDAQGDRNDPLEIVQEQQDVSVSKVPLAHCNGGRIRVIAAARVERIPWRGRYCW